MIASGQPLTVFVSDEFVMEIEWFGVFKENLQKAVDVGGGQKILASGDEGNLLLGVVHHHCEVVGSGDVLAGEDDVTEFTGVDRPGSGAEIVEGEIPAQLPRPFGIEAPGVGFSASDATGPLVGAENAAGSGIEWSFRSVGRGGHAGDLVFDGASGAEAGINHLMVAEAVKGAGVVLQPVRLAECCSLPFEAQPLEVLFDKRIELRPDPGVIDVLKTQEGRSAFAIRQLAGHQGGIGVAKVQPAGGAGCKAGEHGKSLGVQVGGFKLCFVRA
jgi:hypothetical protein